MSEIKLKIVASSGEDLRNQLTALLGGLSSTPVNPVITETLLAADTEKKTRTSKPKTEDPEKDKAKSALEELKEEKGETNTDSGTVITKEDMISKIKAVGKANAEKVKAIIKSYGYEDIYGFKDEEKAEFIKKVGALKGDAPF